ncbi:MAG: hypothetical protein F4207_11085 [Gemmatimonadetes bacterium]|nr:hypothetical protein [Gemmatimonadota bacterium]MYG16949.1 hypothetical protein [Gemmatimonadota bacterium]MYH19763.1 hypothetical protein [Gemmatimonadota bacterium]
MVFLWCFLAGMVITVNAQDQNPTETGMAEIGVFYVAYFETWSKLRYYTGRVDNTTDSKNELWWNADTDRDPLIEDMLSRLKFLSIRKLANISGYKSERLPRRFLGLDVFLVYPPSRDSNPYKLGIRESFFSDNDGLLQIDGFFRFSRLNGFELGIHLPGDTTEFVSYNDPLEYVRLDQVLTHNRSSIDEFVTDWIQLSQYKGHPRDFKLILNEYELIDDTLVGQCETVELDMESGQDALYLHKVWTYEISSSDIPKLENISLRSADIQHDDIEP